MLINIGASRESSDIVDLLLACHERIRSFVGLAGRLAKAENVTDDEVRDAASRVTRYFSEALPLHVADEEQSVLPRLEGRNAELDAVLERMRHEHADHEPQLEILLDTCRKLQQEPERLEELRGSLAGAASALEGDFATHLEQEESVILPAIRSLLTPADRTAMLDELRSRRT